MSEMKKYAGVDISYCQTSVDYKALAAGTILGSKVKFVMIRAAYGTHEDSLFKKHVEGCHAAGLHVGVYVWSRATTPEQAKVEADFVLGLINKYGFVGKIDYPIAIDYEDAELHMNLSAEAGTNIVNAFCEEIKKHNFYPMLYTGLNWSMWEKHVDLSKIPYDLWMAGYVSDNTMSPYMDKFTMWQHSVAGHPTYDIKKVGSVPGVVGQCDVNWAYIGYAKLIKSLGMNKPTVNYMVTGSKKVAEGKLPVAQEELKRLGYTVSVKQV